MIVFAHTNANAKVYSVKYTYEKKSKVNSNWTVCFVEILLMRACQTTYSFSFIHQRNAFDVIAQKNYDFVGIKLLYYTLLAHT